MRNRKKGKEIAGKRGNGQKVGEGKKGNVRSKMMRDV